MNIRGAMLTAGCLGVILGIGGCGNFQWDRLDSAMNERGMTYDQRKKFLVSHGLHLPNNGRPAVDVMGRYPDPRVYRELVRELEKRGPGSYSQE